MVTTGVFVVSESCPFSRGEPLGGWKPGYRDSILKDCQTPDLRMSNVPEQDASRLGEEPAARPPAPPAAQVNDRLWTSCKIERFSRCHFGALCYHSVDPLRVYCSSIPK
jgi:hypothetical protein